MTRRYPRHRALADLALLGQPAEELLEAAVTVRRRRGLVPGQLVDDEGLDVLAGEGSERPWHALFGEEGVELADGLAVRPNGVRRAVGGVEVPPERAEVGEEIGGCGILDRAGWRLRR